MLTLLDLSNNQIEDEGAQYLAEALQKNTVKLDHSSHFIHFQLSLFIQALIRLSLAFNQITVKAAQYLAQALQNNAVRPNQSHH